MGLQTRELSSIKKRRTNQLSFIVVFLSAMDIAEFSSFILFWSLLK